jgi:hypothetical protein
MSKIITIRNREMWKKYTELLRNVGYALKSFDYRQKDMLLFASIEPKMWDEILEVEKLLEPKCKFWDSIVPAEHIEVGGYYKTFRDGYSIPNRIQIVYYHVLTIDEQYVTVEQFSVAENTIYFGWSMETTLDAKNFALCVIDKTYVPVEKAEWDKHLETLKTLKENYDESRADYNQ